MRRFTPSFKHVCTSSARLLEKRDHQSTNLTRCYTKTSRCSTWPLYCVTRNVTEAQVAVLDEKKYKNILWNHVSMLLGAGVATGMTFARIDSTPYTQMEAPANEEKKFEFEQVVERLRASISEFRGTLQQGSSIPPSFPIQKIGISRVHAPNGVSTIRIEFSCPDFVDHEAILGKFISHIQKKTGNQPVVEVYPLPAKDTDVPSIPSVQYMYASGSGSFQFLRKSKGGEVTFTFYKDEYLVENEVDAVVEAYKELFSDMHIHKHISLRMIDRRRRKLSASGQILGNSVDAVPVSKEDAIQELQSLGIEVFLPNKGEYVLDWDSLAGYEDVKHEIEDTVVLALQNPELYDQIAKKTRCRYESNRPRAVLFEGPPGTGKTLSARIIAQQAGVPMVHLPIESVVSKWYGDSEKKMSTIFDAVEKLDGAIIFIDEIDALAGDRSSGTMHEASRRILSVLLQKVEGFSSAKKTTVVCATNRKQDLDAALISRFDLCIRYELPHQSTRQAVFRRYAKQLSDSDLTNLAALSSGLSCRDIKEICEYAERKWASRLLKKQVSEELPDLQAYVDATKVHVRGVGIGQKERYFEA